MSIIFLAIILASVQLVSRIIEEIMALNAMMMMTGYRRRQRERRQFRQNIYIIVMMNTTFMNAIYKLNLCAVQSLLESRPFS